MKTDIGINILCKTAKEQDIVINSRESRAYYEDAYNGSIRKKLDEIISKYTDARTEFRGKTFYHKNGEVSNTILISIYNTKGFLKRELKAELKNYVDAHFKRKFK